MQGGFALLCAVAVTLSGLALSPEVGWLLNSLCSSECGAWCNTVLWAQASGNRAPQGRWLLLADLGLQKWQWEQWLKRGEKEKLLFGSLPGDDVVLLMWVVLQERVMSGAWRARHSSCLCQGTTACGSWAYSFSSTHLPVFTMRYTAHMGVFFQAKFNNANEVPRHNNDWEH